MTPLDCAVHVRQAAADLATKTTIELRPYQREALETIRAAEARGIRRQLIVLPTGTGKTIVFAHLILQLGGRALVLVHRDELLRQAEDKIRLVLPSAHIGIIKAERNELHCPITIASVQTLARPTRLAQLPRVDLIVVDEAHHTAADTYLTILTALGALAPEGPVTVGFTATADPADGQGLDSVFQQIVFERGLLEMIEAGYLADVRAIQVRLLNADFSTLHTRAGDFIEREAEELLRNADAPRHALEAYRQHAAGRKALIFTSGVRLAHEMAATFSKAGTEAAAIDGEMALEERRQVLDRFARGAGRVLVNCQVLIEGYDDPSITCIIIARPTKSRPLYTQMVGRGTRPYPGKDDCLILDLVGTTSRHDLVTAASLFGVNAEALERDTLCDVVARQRQLEMEATAHARLVAQTVDLFRQRRLHWVRGPGEMFILTAGAEHLVLRPEANGWTVLVQRRQGHDVLARNLPLEYAQGTAEDYVRRADARHLADPHARWRLRPASDKQLAALRAFRIPIPPNLTAGQASDYLAQAIARAREARPSRATTARRA